MPKLKCVVNLALVCAIFKKNHQATTRAIHFDLKNIHVKVSENENTWILDNLWLV